MPPLLLNRAFMLLACLAAPACARLASAESTRPNILFIYTDDQSHRTVGCYSERSTDQDRDTIVVFTSDQGFAWGQHGMKSKVAPHAAAVAAPLIFRPAGDGVSGRVIDAPVSGVDLPPTFFAQAGIELPWPMHGRDLSPLLSDQNASWDHPAMLVHTARKYGSATSDIPGNDDPELYHGPGIPWYVMLARGRYKYVRNLVKGETEELYDLKNDPDELRNLVNNAYHQHRLHRFRADTLKELQRTGAGFVNAMPSVANLRK